MILALLAVSVTGLVWVASALFGENLFEKQTSYGNYLSLLVTSCNNYILCVYVFLNSFRPNTHFGALCKQYKPIQIPQKAASDQNLHSLLTEI